ncbi:MAG: hypothetical protein KIS92_02745 [Planctomycetota bacterium]|nr:hypothetical protein [Planctomycetota bacterium]
MSSENDSRLTANPFETPAQKPEPVPTPEKKRGRPPNPETLPESTIDDKPTVRSPPTGEKIIGRDTSKFTVEELEFIRERLPEFTETLGNDRRSNQLVNDAIYYEVEIQRLDEIAGKITNVLSSANVTKLQALQKMRATYQDRYIQTLDLLGALPKDRYKHDPKEDFFLGIWRRYRKELDVMRKRGQRVGSPSPEAKKLARDVGLDPNDYKTPGAMRDAEREELLAKSDAVGPEIDEEDDGEDLTDG